MQGQRNSGNAVLIMFVVQILFGSVSALILFSGRWTGSPWLPAEVSLYWLSRARWLLLLSRCIHGPRRKKKERTLIDASLPLNLMPFSPHTVAALSVAA